MYHIWKHAGNRPWLVSPDNGDDDNIKSRHNDPCGSEDVLPSHLRTTFAVQERFVPRGTRSCREARGSKNALCSEVATEAEDASSVDPWCFTNTSLQNKQQHRHVPSTTRQQVTTWVEQAMKANGWTPIITTAAATNRRRGSDHVADVNIRWNVVASSQSENSSNNNSSSSSSSGIAVLLELDLLTRRHVGSSGGTSPPPTSNQRRHDTRRRHTRNGRLHMSPQQQQPHSDTSRDPTV